MTIATGQQALAADILTKIGVVIFGDGSDGDVTISGDTTLTRDMCYNNLTVDNTFVLTTAGYRIFVLDTLTNNGTIRNNGVSGSNQDGGAGGAGGILNAGGAGGDGRDPGGTHFSGGGGGGGGIVWIAAKTIVNTSGVIEANGGDGANGTTNDPGGLQGAGFVGGSVTGTGGDGGAGGDSDTYAGGVAGVVTIRKFFASDALGGGGGAGGGGSTSIGITNGGGGGGGGGCVHLIYNVTSWGTEQATEGAGGSGASGGSNGANGSAGVVVKIANSST